MVTALQEIDPVGTYRIDQPMFLGDAARSGSREDIFQGLGFADALKRILEDRLDQVEHA